MIGIRKFRTSEARKKARKRLVLRSVLGATAFIFCTVLLIYGTHAQVVRLTHYRIQTDGSLAEEEVSSVLRQEMNGDFLGIIPNDFTLLLSTQRLARTLEKKLPLIKTVEISRTDLHTLHVVITERTPRALWCGDIVPPMVSETKNERNSDELRGTCYFMDDTGYLYARAPVRDTSFPHFYGSLARAEPIGQHFFTQDEFTRLVELYTTLDTEEHPVQALLVVDERDIELYLTTGVRVLAKRDDLDLNNHLSAVLDSSSISGERPIRYIDMRFSGKAYVRYVEDEKVTALEG